MPSPDERFFHLAPPAPPLYRSSVGFRSFPDLPDGYIVVGRGFHGRFAASIIDRDFHRIILLNLGKSGVVVVGETRTIAVRIGAGGELVLEYRESRAF